MTKPRCQRCDEPMNSPSSIELGVCYFCRPPVQHFEPERVELRMCEDGISRWHFAAREGWEVVGEDDGRTLVLCAGDHAVGCRISKSEPAE